MLPSHFFPHFFELLGLLELVNDAETLAAGSRNSFLTRQVSFPIPNVKTQSTAASVERM